MKNYSGNSKPFLFVAAKNADSEQAQGLLSALSAKYKLYLSGEPGRKEQNALKKAAAVLLLFEPDGAAALEPAASLAAQEKKEIIPVYLGEARSSDLPAGLKMLLGAKQGLIRSHYETEEEFAQALIDSPALQTLSVTPAQKRAGRTATLIGIAVLAVLGVAAFFAIRNFTGEEASGALFDKLGISGSIRSLKKIYAYGNELQESFEPYGAVDLETSEAGTAQLYLAEPNKTIARGTVVHINDFAQLVYLEELSLAGNAIRDIRPLYALTKLKKLDLSANYGSLDLTGIRNLTQLEHLNVAFSTISSGLEELKELKSLKTLTISGKYRDEIDALGLSGVTVYYPEMNVRSVEELQAATALGYVHKIVIDTSGLTIPEGQTVTIPAGVSLGAVESSIDNYGTLIFYGNYETGLTRMINYGQIRVEAGARYVSGMGETRNRGEFLVQEGGLQQLERGYELFLEDGTYTNNGTLFLAMGGSMTLSGGKLVNNGTFRTIWESAEDMPDWAFHGDFSQIGGTVVFAYENPDNPSPDYSAIFAKMTEEELAYYRDVHYPSYGGGDSLITPYLETDDFLAKNPDGTAYLARSMELDYQPGWAEPDGFFEFIVAPGAVVTITGGEWNAGTWITVMKGGTLVVNCDFPVYMVANFGTVTVGENGKLYHPASPDPEEQRLYRNFANAGLLQVSGSGSCELYGLWTYQGGTEEGKVNAVQRYDESTAQPPFAFIHEMGGLEAIAAERGR